MVSSPPINWDEYETSACHRQTATDQIHCLPRRYAYLAFTPDHQSQDSARKNSANPTSAGALVGNASKSIASQTLSVRGWPCAEPPRPDLQKVRERPAAKIHPWTSAEPATLSRWIPSGSACTEHGLAITVRIPLSMFAIVPAERRRGTAASGRDRRRRRDDIREREGTPTGQARWIYAPGQRAQVPQRRLEQTF